MKVPVTARPLILALVTEGYSYRAIGARLGISYERVRQLLPRSGPARRLYGRRRWPTSHDAQWLLQERRCRRLTQRAMAAALGCAASTLCAYETGALPLPPDLRAPVQALARPA